MIKYIEHKNIDKQKWDACVDASSNPILFVYSWYLDVVSIGWNALILDDYKAVFPLPKKTKYNINYIHQPFFTRYYGVYSSLEITESLVNNFLNAIPEKFKYIQLCLHQSNFTSNKNFYISEKKYQQLDLNKSYEELFKQFSDNTKRNYKKALKSGFIVKDYIAPEQIVNLFKSTKGDELEVFKPNDYKTLLELMDVCLKNQQAETLAVYDKENTLCAAAFFMKSNNRFMFLKSGVTEQGRTNGAMHLLFNNFIQKYAETVNALDFGGSSVESVARFYKNFGAKDFVYLQVKKNSLPRIVKWIRGLSLNPSPKERGKT
jgi:hypothetical protein